MIESGGSDDAATIKSHHNVGGLPDDLEFELVEPLRMLFKDEVRAVGAELGLPERMVWRQPFPGPGLAIRIVGGEVNKERLDILRAADAILQEEIRAAELYRQLWQSFCVLPVVRSVGVQGDGRTYAYPIVIRAVTSDDAMTADWARLPYDLLERVSNRIINEITRRQPRGAGHLLEAPRDDRVGVSSRMRLTVSGPQWRIGTASLPGSCRSPSRSRSSAWSRRRWWRCRRPRPLPPGSAAAAEPLVGAGPGALDRRRDRGDRTRRRLGDRRSPTWRWSRCRRSPPTRWGLIRLSR